MGFTSENKSYGKTYFYVKNKKEETICERARYHYTIYKKDEDFEGHILE